MDNATALSIAYYFMAVLLLPIAVVVPLRLLYTYLKKHAK